MTKTLNFTLSRVGEESDLAIRSSSNASFEAPAHDAHLRRCNGGTKVCAFRSEGLTSPFLLGATLIGSEPESGEG